jgi:acetolactate synthase-1/2/3 large subunit
MKQRINESSTNGADVVVDALVANGVNVFFSNPGTSEIHLVSAIDKHEGARAVLCLFEGVATGAADGYGRASGKPAAVLLHLGPGLANGLANLHNAAKARTPMVVVVGDHATHHLQYDTPLRSDLPSLANFAAKAVFNMQPGDDLRRIIGEAVRTANTLPRGPVVLVANADVMWLPADGAPTQSAKELSAVSIPKCPEDLLLDNAVSMLKKGSSTLLLAGGDALTQENLALIDRIAQATGCTVFSETFNARHERGAGVSAIARLPYIADMAAPLLAKIDQCVLIGARRPVAFFASPDARSELTRPGTEFWEVGSDIPVESILTKLATTLAPDIEPRFSPRELAVPEGLALTPRSIWSVMNQLLPEGAVVSDESGVTSVGADERMQVSNRHTWFNLTGGSIGQGLPLAMGAAIGRDQAQVVAVHGDGGAMYTLQALWTQQREKLQVVNLIFRNDSYSILEYEVKRHGLGPLGEKGKSMFALTDPTLDWVQLARGMGMAACSVNTVAEFQCALSAAFRNEGPALIEVRLSREKKGAASERAASH